MNKKYITIAKKDLFWYILPIFVIGMAVTFLIIMAIIVRTGVF